MDYTKLTATAKKIDVYLKGKQIKSSIKKSRYQTQINAVEVAYPGSIEALLKEAKISGTVSDLTVTEEKSISGKYKAKLITIKAAVASCAAKEQFLIVNTFTEKGSLKTKDLAPDKLFLTDKKFKTLAEFDKAVYAGIKAVKVPNDVKDCISTLYDTIAANKTHRDNIPMNAAAKKAFKVIKPQDKQAIGKDFGEVLSLRWYLTQNFAKGWTECYFSLESNAALVDYIIKVKVGTKIIPIDVSAKFEAGAAPSIGAIVNNIKTVYKNPTAEEKTAIGVLQALALTGSGNTSTKILAAYKTLNLPVYKKLKTLVGKADFTIEDISAKIQKIASASNSQDKRIKMFNTEFKEIYDTLGKYASEDSLKVVFSTPTYKKYYSLILAPMGYALVAYMNKTPIYQEILNNISREMKTEQVYLTFPGESMGFEKKLFSNATFKFDYGSNAKDSDNTGIKFSMK
ncbi:MAG: hypothetical protein ACO294_12610 [Methylococcales bacterium]